MAKTQPVASSSAPPHARRVLAALILGAFVCNINLSVANVALPDIGKAFDSAQSALTFVAVGCTLGLAMSVLYFGALGDRYGRKFMLLLGLLLTVPAALLSAFAPTVEVLMFGRLLTGLAAGMAYPTTLALITALWADGKERTRAIALWQAVSGGAAVFGPALAGAFLEFWWWGSVFLIVVPVAIVAWVLNARFVPAHVSESTKPVDHLGGVLSVLMIATLVLGLGTLASPNARATTLALLGSCVLFTGGFIWRQAKTKHPLYELRYAKRRLFWLPAVAGMIVLGALSGAMFIGQQFLQNVLQYDTFEAGTAILPAAVGMLLVASISARLVDSLGPRFTMLLGYSCIFPAFLIMLAFWREGVSYLFVGLAYLLIGVGAGLVLTPSARALTSSVPVQKVGMASGTSDLQRDLGGSVFQTILGTILTIGYAAAFSARVQQSPEAQTVSADTQAALSASFSSAADVAAQYPNYANAIFEAARQSFLDGAGWAYTIGAACVLAGGLLVFVLFPRRTQADAMFATYVAEDSARTSA